MIRAGEVSIPMTLQEPPPRDGFRKTQGGWTDAATVYGRPLHNSAAERYVSPSVLASVDFTFNVRHNPLIQRQRRLLLPDGRVLLIKFAITLRERRTEMIVGATEVLGK